MQSGRNGFSVWRLKISHCCRIKSKIPNVTSKAFITCPWPVFTAVPGPSHSLTLTLTRAAQPAQATRVGAGPHCRSFDARASVAATPMLMPRLLRRTIAKFPRDSDLRLRPPAPEAVLELGSPLPRGRTLRRVRMGTRGRGAPVRVCSCRCGQVLPAEPSLGVSQLLPNCC